MKRITIIVSLLLLLGVTPVLAQQATPPAEEQTPIPDPYTPDPNEEPTEEPIEAPGEEPTEEPSEEPTEEPTQESATPTMAPTATPEQTPTPTATTDYGGDPYEVDSRERPAQYTGPQERAFAPAGDEDFIVYRLKDGQTVIEAGQLRGAADTAIEVIDLVTGEVLGVDDDGGAGLASRLQLNNQGERDVVIRIYNKSLGWGSDVGYRVVIIPQANFTPTATSPATATAVPTQQPLPTYTPYPSPTPPPTAVPRPAGPRPTATPTTQFILRVEIFTDSDADGVLDPGEGIENVMVEVASRDGSTFEALQFTQNGVMLMSVECPPGKPPLEEVEVRIPYLQHAQFVQVNENGQVDTVSIALARPILPIAMP